MNQNVHIVFALKIKKLKYSSFDGQISNEKENLLRVQSLGLLPCKGGSFPPFCLKSISHPFHWLTSRSEKSKTSSFFAEKYFLTPLKGGQTLKK